MFSLKLIDKVSADAVNTTVTNPLSAFTNVGQIFGFVTNLLIGIGWGMVFVMLALGFMKYITSRGEAKETQGAQQWLTYAVIGGVGLLAIQLIRTLALGLVGLTPASINVGGGVSPL